MHNKSSVLSRLAMQAKQRLNGASNEKQSSPKKDLTTQVIYKNLYRNNFKIIAYIDDEEEFYKKVKRLVRARPDSPSVLKELVNVEEYSKLDEEQKMGYMLKLAERYSRAKQRLSAEQFPQKEYEEMTM